MFYDSEKGDRGYFAYEDFIPYVPGWADKVGWTYVPLAGEHDVALFVVARSRVKLLMELDRMLGEQVIVTDTLVEMSGSPCLRSNAK